MNPIKFLHTADWHADSDPKKQVKLQSSLDQILDYLKKNKINALIHAGDIWEKSQKYQFNSGVPIVLKFLHEAARLVDFIFITKGNNSHDEPGSISLLHQIEQNIYAFEYPVCLAVGNSNIIDSRSPSQVVDLIKHEGIGDPLRYINYIISLVPYPTKASFISEDSIDNNNEAFLEKFESVFELIDDITKSYSCPKILAFHGNIVGSRLSSGQSLVSQDIMVSPSTLQKAGAGYYALGHIHLYQMINPIMFYSGSIYNKNWGETEQKSFQVIQFNESGEINIERIVLEAAVPMIKLEGEFKDGKFIIEEDTTYSRAEYRLRIKVNENERKLITDDKIEELKDLFGHDVKIEYDIIPSERESRSEKIMHCKTLLDEVKEYAAVVNELINGTVEQKIITLQESGVTQ